MAEGNALSIGIFCVQPAFRHNKVRHIPAKAHPLFPEAFTYPLAARSVSRKGAEQQAVR